jgi:hypothetical protein
VHVAVNVDCVRYGVCVLEIVWECDRDR